VKKPGFFFFFLSAAGMLLQTGCTLIPAAENNPQSIAVKEGISFWPPENPRIRLEMILPSRKARRRSSPRRANVFQRPYGVAFDGEDLLVADPGAGRILRFDAKGKISRSAEGLSPTPMSVSVCSDGIMVSDSSTGSVLLLDKKLHLRRILAEGLKRPTGTACIGERHFVVETGAHRLVELFPGAPRVISGGRGVEAGRFNFPAALATDGRCLWVGDTLNGRVQQIDPDSGEVLNAFGQTGDAPGNMPRIKGIAVDAAGDIWISDALLDQLSLYDHSGSYLMSVGRRGPASGELSFPAGLAADKNGRVAVADSLNRRIQIFAPVEGKEK